MRTRSAAINSGTINQNLGWWHADCLYSIVDNPAYEAMMASATLAIAQIPVSASPKTVGGQLPAKEIDSKNQSDKVDFPRLMKKVKGDTGGKKEDSSPPPILLPDFQVQNAILPPTGMQLPPAQARNQLPPASARNQLPHSDKTSSTPAESRPTIDNTDQVKLSMLFNLNGGEPKADAKRKGDVQTDIIANMKTAQIVETSQKAATHLTTEQIMPTIKQDNEQQAIANTDINMVMMPVSSTHIQSDQLTSQVINDKITSSILEKHTALIDPRSLATQDSANVVNALGHGIDKGVQAAPQQAISVPLNNPQWNEDLNNRVMWMVQHDVQSANIKINPPHLGPLEVQVSVNKDHVDVSFNSHHVLVKEALDASIPRLKEMMGNSGLQLGNANVTHHSFSGQNQQNSQGTNYSYNGSSHHFIEANTSDIDDIAAAPLYSWNYDSGAIDFYA